MAQQRYSVAGIALDENRVFIARRKSGGDIGGKWEFPGGKVEINENAEAALIREYREEFDLAVSVGQRIGASSFTRRDTVYNLDVYRIFFESALENITLSEHTQWKWASLDEIYEIDFADSDRALLALLENYLKGQ